MALFTSNLGRPFLLDSTSQQNDKRFTQKLIEPVAIDERQFKEIHDENMKNEKFADNYTEVNMARERYEMKAQEAKKTFNELTKWKKMLECWPEVLREVQSGRPLTGKIGGTEKSRIVPDCAGSCRIVPDRAGLCRFDTFFFSKKRAPHPQVIYIIEMRTEGL